MIATIFRTAQMSAGALAIVLTGGLSPASALEVGFLGVSVQAVEDAIAEALALAPGEGVLVASVLAESPARDASIKIGDVIVAVEKNTVSSPSEFRRSIRAYEAGKSIDLRILRNQKYMNLTAILGEPPKRPHVEKESVRVRDFTSMKKAAMKPWIGVELKDLEDHSLASYFGVGSNGGSLITGIHDESPAQKAGLESGDVIVQFGDQKVSEGADLIRAVRERKAGDSVEISYMRKGDRETVELTLEKRPMDLSLRMPGLPDMPRMHQRAPMAPHAPHFQKKDGKSRGAIDELREELEELRRELQELRDES